VAQLFEEMKRVAEMHRMLICRGEVRPGDPMHWEADITRLRQLAPLWRPRSLRDGLAETIAEWRSKA
jgi:hypothetical protein